MSDEIRTGDFVDTDHLPEDENPLFPGKLLLKLSVTKPGNYVLKSSTVNGHHTKFAVALSDHIVKVYDVHGKLWDEYEHDKAVTDIKFSTVEPSILFTSSLDGKIHVWDTRCQGTVQTFIDNSDGALKPLLCFDYNLNEQILCAGTEVIREDSFLLFWDRRTSEILGGYWNSHAGDITQIHFHPSENSWMASSSVDGLINVFDLNQTTEDDALINTLNVESPVNTFTWRSSDFLSCTTSIEEFHIWSLNDVQSKLCMPRRKFYDTYRVNVNYLFDTHKIQKYWYLATGTNKGAVYLWNTYKNSLNPLGYLLKGHSDVVRTICYNDMDDVILTGGDDGCVCYWKVYEYPINVPSSC